MQFITTTPLFYVNAAPHMGSAYPTIAVDALTRYYRLCARAERVLMVTGSDEHGEKIATTAEKQGLQPQVHCDRIVDEFKLLWQKLDITYDRFIRTTDPRHERIVREFFQRVWDRGDIYKARYEGLYCVDCEEFKDPKDLLPENRCDIHRKPVVARSEENYFFALARYQEKLEDHFARHPDFVQPEVRRNEVLGWVKEGLRDFSISRAQVTWGIPIPTDPAQTVYVWFDALLGYVTALLEPQDEPTLENALSRGWPAQLHVIGKDILRFHAVYWPAMLLSAGLPLPERVFGHGYLTKDGLKMGKSLGNVLDPHQLVDRYGADAVRYYFLKTIEFGKDGDFAHKRFIDTLNADLANDLGNLLNRTLGLLRKNCNNLAPCVPVPEDNLLRLNVADMVGKAQMSYEALDFTRACEAALEIARTGNSYVALEEPWTLFKKDQREKAEQVLYTVLEAARIAAVILSPITPRLSARLYAQLGFSPEALAQVRWQAGTQWGGLPGGQQVAEAQPIFPRLEYNEEDAL
ncbi:methionine--tRNA ligase [Anthocerotibacter panamensis]|uniref:methionine--tRNA ligase n=1 Tax=Anthocerotibacter panamensis TaxID=2857077 RepID=UPI001C4066ED|nr:methionine--tRNA ligase [Anthocerotibacter panamensis]